MNDIERFLEEAEVPPLMKFKDGGAVKTKEDFLLRREELKDILCKYEYGYMPERPIHLSVTERRRDERFLAGKAPLGELLFKLTFENGEFCFPVKAFIPLRVKNAPAFIYIGDEENIPNEYLPCEEICDSGFEGGCIRVGILAQISRGADQGD